MMGQILQNPWNMHKKGKILTENKVANQFCTFFTKLNLLTPLYSTSLYSQNTDCCNDYTT